MQPFLLESWIKQPKFVLLNKYNSIMKSANLRKNAKTKRSVQLDSNVRKMLAKHIASFKKPVDAAVAIGLDRNTMQRINREGSGSPQKIQTVIDFFNSKKSK